MDLVVVTKNKRMSFYYSSGKTLMTGSSNLLTKFPSLPLISEPTSPLVIQAHIHLDTFGMYYERTEMDFHMVLLCDERHIT